MVFQIARPTRRRRSSIFQFSKRLPAALVDGLTGVQVQFRLPPATLGEPEEVVSVKLRDPFTFSLRTKDPSLVVRRPAAALVQVDGMVRALPIRQST